MCARCDALGADLTAEVMLAAAERELILTQADAGESVPQATRPLSDAERKAKMRFSEIEALEQSAADKAAKLLAGNAQVYIMATIGAIFGEEDAVPPSQVVDAIETLNRAQPAVVTAEITRAQKAMSGILSQVYTGAALIVAGEAARQGVKNIIGTLQPADGQFDDLAKAVALRPWSRLTSKLQADMLEPRTLAQPEIGKADVQGNLEAIPLDGANDLAKQAVHAAHGQGRVDAAVEMAPEEIYSSELLDGKTCDACANVDGKDYTSMAEALTEYETGGYGACKGGARCRGTLVFQYNALGTDAPPIVPDPQPVPALQPDEPKPAPKKTPRKRTPAKPQPKPETPPVIQTPPDAPAPKVVPKVEPAPAPKATPKAEPKPVPAPEPAPKATPPAPTGTPPKRVRGQSQRYTELNQLPVDKYLDTAPYKNERDALADARFINPGFKQSSGADKNYSNNCSSVVMAFEMRRRGFDVFAAPVRNGAGRHMTEYIQQWWKDRDGKPVMQTYAMDLPPVKGVRAGTLQYKARLDAHIEAMPDGARGVVAVGWAKGGGGHVFNFEKIDGKAVYLEGQTGFPDASGHLAEGKFTPKTLRVVRLDDKIPTDKLTTALETRPAELAAELESTLPSVDVMRKQSETYTKTNPDGTRTLVIAKYRVNPITAQWERTPELIIKREERQFRQSEAMRKKNMGL